MKLYKFLVLIIVLLSLGAVAVYILFSSDSFEYQSSNTTNSTINETISQ